MKPRKLKPRPKPLLTRTIPYACGPHNDFWLFREGERAYNDYRELLPRKDAPVHLPFDVYFALPKELGTIPSLHLAGGTSIPGIGLNWDNTNIINQTGGAAFSAVCRKAAQEWAHGPEPLVITNGTTSIVGSHKPPKPYRFKVDLASLVRDLETLADWGDKAATGEFFILHIGM